MQSILRFKAKSMWPRLPDSLFLLKDLRIERIGGNLLKRKERCFWFNRCSKPRMRRSEGWLSMPL